MTRDRLASIGYVEEKKRKGTKSLDFLRPTILPAVTYLDH